MFMNEDDDLDDDNTDQTEPSIILFVIGGISVNEIVALERLQNRISHKLYIGSTNQITSKSYLKTISEIKSESDMLFDNNKNDNTVDLKDINFK